METSMDFVYRAMNGTGPAKGSRCYLGGDAAWWDESGQTIAHRR